MQRKISLRTLRISLIAFYHEKHWQPGEMSNVFSNIAEEKTIAQAKECELVSPMVVG